MELGGLTRGSQFDGIEATGNVNLDGSLSVVRINGGSGTFAGLNEGDTFNDDGNLYVISYLGMNYMTYQLADGANGFSVVIAAVPEPTTWALIGLGIAGCSWVGYRRFRTSRLVFASEVTVVD